MKKTDHLSRVRTLRGVCLAATMLTGLSGTAFAQDNAAQDAAAAEPAPAPAQAGDGEIVVTALKRDTRLQDTPISISAVGGQTIANAGVQSIADLGASVPSLHFVDGGPSNRRVIIRGIQAAGEPTVGVYYDETPVTGVVGAGNDAGGSTPELRLFDVDRVEVLRGPQGTLYGSGSMGGTLRVIYKKPTDKWEGGFDGSMSSTHYGGINMETNGMINIPVVSDKIDIRATGFYKRNDGYIDNTWLNVKNINDQESYGGRILVRIKPTSKLTIDGAAYLNRSNSDTSSWFLESGQYRTDSRTRLPVRDKVDLYSGTATWDLGPVTATAIVSYMERSLSSQSDTSRYIAQYANMAGYNRFCATACSDENGAPIKSYAAYLDYILPQTTSSLFPQQTMNALTSEFRLNSSGSGPVHWTVGGFYSRRATDVDNPQVNVDPTSGQIIYPLQIDTERFIHDVLKQVAAFVDVSWDITPRLNLTGGMRYFSYDKNVQGYTTVPSFLVGARVTPLTTVSSSEDGEVFKANLSYKITRDVMFYFEAAQGFRPGGVNQVLGLAESLTPYESDKLWDYEAGFKTTWFNRRLTFNADVFRLDWTNIQVSGRTPNGAFSFITNAGAARVQGVEIETSLRPITGLSLSGNVSYLTAALTENQSNSQVQAPGLKGDRIPYVPEITAGGSAEYNWALTSRLNGLARVDYTYAGDSYSDFRPTATYTRYVPSYGLVNLRAGIEGSADKKWGLYLFVTNVLDKVAILRASSSAIGVGLTSVTTAPPRTIGVNFRVSL